MPLDLDALVQEKLDADTSFTDSIAALPEEDKAQAIADKRAEITKLTFSEVADKAKKQEELASNYKTRAEKAEDEVKTLKPKPKEPLAPAEEVLSEKDRMALYKADVHLDDLDEVIQAAKVLKLPLHEALSNDIVKGIIAKKAEHRKTAEAANTRTQRPASKEPTDDQVQDDLSKGIIPEKGTKAAEQLFYARRGGKR